MDTGTRRRKSGSRGFDLIQVNSVSSSSCNRPRIREMNEDPSFQFHTHQQLQVPNPVPDSTSKALILVLIIFTSSLLALGLIYKQFPDLEEDEKQHLRLPLTLEDAKQLGLVLDRYKDKYFYEVLSGVFLIYILLVHYYRGRDKRGCRPKTYRRPSKVRPDRSKAGNPIFPAESLQTFAIPGSIFLSILSGFLFPFYLALLLVCCCSAIGASLCFFLSNLFGKRLVRKYFPERAAQWSTAVNKHQNNLLNYIIFLRVTPFLPNWFINMSAPVIGVPLVPFALGTFIGVAPPSFVAIQAGQTLHTLTSTSDAWSWTSVTVLTVFAMLSLIPVLLKNRLREKFD